MINVKQPRIGVVVIVFHIDESLFKAKLRKLGERLCIVVVDNTPDVSIDIRQSNVSYIPLMKNTGIAYAQDEGIRFLERQGCSYVVFFDQDSDFNEAFVYDMVAEYKRIERVYDNLFLLGPRVVNKTNGEEYRSVIHRDKKVDNGFVCRREIISSGCCVSMSKLCDVGDMDTRLFIDFIDFEHCWRANAKGYVCGITENVVLLHQVGNRELNFPCGYHVIISAPFRYYYQCRNWLWLCRRKYVPLQWKVSNGIKLIARIFYFPFCVKGWRNIEMFMFKGFKDGIFKH